MNQNEVPPSEKKNETVNKETPPPEKESSTTNPKELLRSPTYWESIVAHEKSLQGFDTIIKMIALLAEKIEKLTPEEIEKAGALCLTIGEAIRKTGSRELFQSLNEHGVFRLLAEAQTKFAKMIETRKKESDTRQKAIATQKEILDKIYENQTPIVQTPITENPVRSEQPQKGFGRKLLGFFQKKK